MYVWDSEFVVLCVSQIVSVLLYWFLECGNKNVKVCGGCFNIGLLIAEWFIKLAALPLWKIELIWGGKVVLSSGKMLFEIILVVLMFVIMKMVVVSCSMMMAYRVLYKITYPRKLFKVVSKGGPRLCT